MSELALRPAEQEIALAETRAVLQATTRAEYRDELAALEAAIAAGELDSGQAESLEHIVELALQTGRVRALYGPPGEQATLKLYRRLPRGAAFVASAREVSDALQALRGRPLEGASLAAVGPGSYTLSLSAGEARLSVRLDRQGARVTTVEV